MVLSRKKKFKFNDPMSTVMLDAIEVLKKIGLKATTVEESTTFFKNNVNLLG